MNGWKPALFCKDLGQQIHDPFFLAISRGEFCEPNCFRGEQLVKNNMPAQSFKDSKQDSKEETKYHEKRYSQVKCNLEKAVLRVEQEHETVYLTDV